MAGKKSSLLAAVLSVLIAGAGHFYLGNIKRGLFFFLLGEVLSAAVYFYADPAAGGMLGVFGSAYAAYDAYRLAKESTGTVEANAKNMPDIRV